ncbi:DUF3626 domain-containing protein [Psychromicrobium lacuslunae]|uniref:DUF3626 domain-containing protein n=1 Tax=Psychromicrobium lacuslunae TaxID=1618207 RepID=UPI0009E4F5D4|nr:DUF3626 domain-containing protein [Psychromicrobium lacuslunae]
MEAWERAFAYLAGAVPAGPRIDADLEVTVHFHPDRAINGKSLLDHLASDGVYRSQFETGTSNGGLTAYPGGDRWRWEHRIFGGHYDISPADQRPKYGSLNYRRHAAGGSVRFGSAHLKLAPSVLERTTFCYPDSVTEPTDFGTAAHLPLVQLALEDTLDVIDDHIEAHIHGPMRLDQDVSELVLDPSFRDTPVAEAAAKLPFPFSWHHGFKLHVDQLRGHEAFRGANVVELGVAIAQDGWLTPKIVGEAVNGGHHDPDLLKKVWHCLARFGHDWAS